MSPKNLSMLMMALCALAPAAFGQEAGTPAPEAATPTVTISSVTADQEVLSSFTSTNCVAVTVEIAVQKPAGAPAADVTVLLVKGISSPERIVLQITPQQQELSLSEDGSAEFSVCAGENQLAGTYMAFAAINAPEPYTVGAPAPGADTAQITVTK